MTQTELSPSWKYTTEQDRRRVERLASLWPAHSRCVRAKKHMSALTLCCELSIACLGQQTAHATHGSKRTHRDYSLGRHYASPWSWARFSSHMTVSVRHRVLLSADSCQLVVCLVVEVCVWPRVACLTGSQSRLVKLVRSRCVRLRSDNHSTSVTTWQVNLTQHQRYDQAANDSSLYLAGNRKKHRCSPKKTVLRSGYPLTLFNIFKKG